MSILYVICLAQLATASYLRPHRETLLVTDAETVLENVRAAYRDELTLLDTETRQLDSMILDVQNHLQHALKTFQSVGNTSSAKANVTSSKANVTSEKASEKANVTNAKAKVAMAATAKTSAKMSKAEVKATLSKEQSLLNDLMKHLNNQIGNFNKEDSEAKEVSEKMIKRFQEKLKKDEAALNKTGLRDFDHARLVNATRMDKQDLAYWTKDQQLRHSMFHANLQMSKNLQMSVKNVLGAYNKAVAKGAVDDGLLKEVQAAAVTGSFLQFKKDLQQRMQKYQVYLNQRLSSF